MLEVTFTLSDGYDGDWMYFFTNNITGEEIVFTLPLSSAGFLMIRRPPRSTHCISSAASDVYKRQHP